MPGKGGGKGAQLGHIWREHGATKWDRRQPFIVRERAALVLFATGRLRISGTNPPHVGLGLQEITELGADLVRVLSRWNLATSPVGTGG